MPAQPPANLSRSLKFLVVVVLYFAEGMPFGFIITAMNAYMAGQGVPPEQIGILSLLGLAWSLKFFWSPLVDLTGSRASWMVGAQVAMILCFLGLSFLVGQRPRHPLVLGLAGGLVRGIGHPGPGDRRLHHRFPGDQRTGDGQRHPQRRLPGRQPGRRGRGC